KLCALLAVRSELRELISLSVDTRLVRVARLDAQKNVVQRDRVTLPLVETDQVITELRQYGLRDLTGFQCVRGTLERCDEAAFGAATQIATPCSRGAVRGLSLRDVLEFGTANNLVPKGNCTCTNRGAVRRTHHSGNLQDSEHRPARPTEVLLVLVEIPAEVCIRDRLRD